MFDNHQLFKKRKASKGMNKTFSNKSWNVIFLGSSVTSWVGCIENFNVCRQTCRNMRETSAGVHVRMLAYCMQETFATFANTLAETCRKQVCAYNVHVETSACVHVRACVRRGPICAPERDRQLDTQQRYRAAFWLLTALRPSIVTISSLFCSIILVCFYLLTILAHLMSPSAP